MRHLRALTTIRIAPILATLVCIACGGQEVTQPQSRTPGSFVLIPLQGLAGSVVKSATASQAGGPAPTSASGSGFDLGTIKNTTNFYFLLRNGGGTSITGITLSSSNAAFQVVPQTIDSVPPDSTAGLLPIIKVIAVHGTSPSGIGFAALMAPGTNTTIVSIQGTTTNASGAATPVHLDANMSVTALLVDVTVLDGSSVVDLAKPPVFGLGANTCGVSVPGFYRDIATLTLQNTGNVPLAVSMWVGSASVPRQQTVAPTGLTTVPDTDTTVQLDGGGTISDHVRLPLTPCGTVILNFFARPVHFDSLLFTVQPSNTAHGSIITPPIQVEVVDSLGRPDTSFHAAVTIAISTNPTAGSVLSGTTSVVPVNAIATFGDLSISLAGTGYTLKVSAPGIRTAVTSAPFNIQ